MDPAPERILIVKLGALGDVVNSLPLVNRLRAGLPDARLTWLIGPAAQRLVAGHPAVDEFLVLDSRRARAWPGIVRALRRRRFDLALDLQRLAKSGLLVRLSGAPRRLGFDRARCKEHSHLFTNLHLAPNPRPGTTVAQYLEFADRLGLPERPVEWRLPHVPFEESGGRPVTLVLGATKSANRWPPERWAELARGLVERIGARVVLCGGPEDRTLADAVLSRAGVALDDRVGRLDLPRSAGLLAASELVIACDTGPLHIAVAVGTPVLALFGAADPARTGPHGRPGDVLWEPAPCSPCRRRTCFVPGHPCMKNLSAAAVLERALERLGQRI